MGSHKCSDCCNTIILYICCISSWRLWRGVHRSTLFPSGKCCNNCSIYCSCVYTYFIIHKLKEKTYLYASNNSLPSFVTTLTCGNQRADMTWCSHFHAKQFHIRKAGTCCMLDCGIFNVWLYKCFKFFPPDIFLFCKHSNCLSLLLYISKSFVGLWNILHAILLSTTGKSNNFIVANINLTLNIVFKCITCINLLASCIFYRFSNLLFSYCLHQQRRT